MSERCGDHENATNTLLAYQRTTPFYAEGLKLAEHAVTDTIAAAAALKLDPNRTVVLINGGLELAINRPKDMLSPKQEVLLKLPGIMSALEPVAAAGGAVHWRTSTQICCMYPQHYNSTVCHGKGGDKADMIAVRRMVKEGNRAAEVILREFYPTVGVLDGFALTTEGLGGLDEACKFYEDFVHAPILARRQIVAWMKGLLKCSCEN